MNLFIANATKRKFHLHYRLPGMERIFDVLIDAGQQWRVHDAHSDQDLVEAIIKQIEAYGAKPVSKIESKGFTGIAYSTDKPISFEAIEAGLSQVDQLAIETAFKNIQQRAVAADREVAQIAKDAGAEASGLEIEINQQAQPGTSASDLTKTKIDVQREGAPERKKGARARA